MTAADGRGLLDALIADPDDETARLVYADFLEESGDTNWIRRALMRGQEFRTIEGGVINTVFPELGDMVARLGLEVWVDGARWRYADRVGPTVRPATERIGLRHGFVDFLRMNLNAALKYLPALARNHPIRRVELTNRRPLAMSNDNGSLGWFPATDSEDLEDLPPSVIASMEGWHRPTLESGDLATVWVAYRAEKDAIDALSAALLAWARSRPFDSDSPATGESL